METQDQSLIDALQDPAVYDHAVEYLKIVETHISWVLLTGPYAYKIKKAIDLGFLDFSTLELRRHYCQEELRLNRRLAPQIYVDVIPITGTASRPRLGGKARPFEYAVKMRQFDPEDQFDRLLAARRLTADHVDRLAQTIARFHEGIDRASPAVPYGEPDAVHRAVVESLDQIAELAADGPQRARLRRLRRWCEDQRLRLDTVMRARKANGFIRECHGDLHLANITLYNGEVTAFDCLEFNETLRWIDTISEAAFLTMDFNAHRRSDLANRFMNSYLHFNGDYEGLRMLRYYQVYRALVRAKVAAIRKTQSRPSTSDAAQQLRRYLALADCYTRDRPTALLITHGLSGSGKTTVSAPLAESCGAVRMRSDVERKRLFGLPPDARTDSQVGGDLYSRDASTRTYQRLADLAETVIKSGYSPLVDAAFLRRRERDQFRDLAVRLQVPFIILDFHAPRALLRQWVTERAREGKDASEADIEVLERQIQSQEPLDDAELAHIVAVNTGVPVDIPKLAACIRGRLAPITADAGAQQRRDDQRS